MDEIWITIKNFDKYQISNLGRIKSLYYNKIRYENGRITFYRK